MTRPPDASQHSAPNLVNGIDVDAVAAAVRSCLDVDDLDGGAFDTVASYLPGRRVPGVRVGADRITIQLRSRWGVPMPQIGRQVRAAVLPLIGRQTLDIVVSDIADPPELPPAAEVGESEVVWTSNTASVPAELGSGTITPIGVETPTSSAPD